MDLLAPIERSGIEQKFYEMCERVVSEHALVIYDFEYVPRSQTLRVFILNPESNTATIDECAKVDHGLSPYFEQEEWIPENIMLEVSSPGVFRELNQRWHFERVLNQQIAVKLKKPLTDGQLPRFIKGEKRIVGILQEILDQKLVVMVRDHKMEIEFENIKKANLEPDI